MKKWYKVVVEKRVLVQADSEEEAIWEVDKNYHNSDKDSGLIFTAREIKSYVPLSTDDKSEQLKFGFYEEMVNEKSGAKN